MKMKQYSISYGRNKIIFSLEQNCRKTLKISVLPDLSVKVVAPHGIPFKAILAKIKKRAAWIINKIEYFRTFHPLRPPKKYISGETHHYLGRQYRLKVVQDKINKTKLNGQYLYLYTTKKDNLNHNRVLLYNWYRERAFVKFHTTYEVLLSKLKKYSINEPTLKVKTMKARWGSCNARKEAITLNTELIKAPSHCIEYVIMHELCHMKYPNHNRQFYDFLALVMPNWIERKRRLEKVIL